MEINAPVVEDATEKKEEPIASPADTTDAADGEGGGEEAASESGGKKGGKTKKGDAPIPAADDFADRKRAGWKPTPFPDGVNIASAMAEIRARKAEECLEEIRVLVGEHASSGMWPTNKLQVIANEARDKRDAAEALKRVAEEQSVRAEKAKQDRAEEKKAQLSNLEASIAKALMAALKENAKSDILARMQAGVDAALSAFKEWAPKINSWPAPTIKKAVDIAVGATNMEEDAVRKILEEAPTETAKPKPEKRKAVEEAGSSVDETPKKPKSTEAAEPPNQKTKYRISKKGKNIAGEPAAAAAAAADAADAVAVEA